MANYHFLSALLLAVGLSQTAAYSQTQTDSIKLDTSKIISFALDGNIPKALETVNAAADYKMSNQHMKVKKGYNERFGTATDQSDYLERRHSAIDGLLVIYCDYWRKSFLDYPKVHNSMLRKNLSAFLNKNYKPAKNLKVSDSDKKFGKYLVNYIKSKGLHTTGFSQTGRFYDLLVWKKETDTLYQFTLNGQKIHTPVVFMEDFITLGWEEYATLDKAFPGGWAKPEALYCVKQAYSLDSESFRISYLAHEGRHSEDYKLFPKLVTADLEYRAKLTELSLLDTTLFEVLFFFVTNADAKTEDGHKKADYYVVSNLSKRLFNVDFESDMGKWKSLDLQTIHAASAELLSQNTFALQKSGKQTQTLLKSSTP